MAFIPIPPVTTTIVSPIISVSMPYSIEGTGITYAQFLQSLGSYSYGVEFFYLSTTSYQQIGQPFFYNHFDANGNSISTFLPFSVDPYQAQPSLFYETEPDQIILTGLTSLQFNLFSQNTIFFKFFAQVTYMGNELDDKNSNSGDNLFEEIEKNEGISFFDDYCNYIID
jgi:hypothetical protein